MPGTFKSSIACRSNGRCPGSRAKFADNLNRAPPFAIRVRLITFDRSPTPAASSLGLTCSFGRPRRS